MRAEQFLGFLAGSPGESGTNLRVCKLFWGTENHDLALLRSRCSLTLIFGANSSHTRQFVPGLDHGTDRSITCGSFGGAAWTTR